MQMLVDKQAAIKLIQNEVTSSNAKHVDVKLKFSRLASDQDKVYWNNGYGRGRVH